MAKGIRVNQLAKELGVESKAILSKCRDEGLGEKVPNHMSVLSIGLAETVREWFSGGANDGGGTAVETAAPPAVKAKKPRAKKKAEPGEEDFDETPSDETETAEVSDDAASAPSSMEAVAEVVAEPEVTTHAPVETAPPEPELAEPVVADTMIPTQPAVQPEMDIAPAPAAHPAIPPVKAAPTHAAPPAATTPPVAHPAPAANPAPAVSTPRVAAAHAPAAPRAGTPPHAPGATRAPGAPGAGPVSRPTIRLSDRRDGPAVVERSKSVVQAPKLVNLEPAKMQGPRVVREEKPDNLPAPRPRRPIGGGPGAGPAFSPARPLTGRGVKLSEEEEEEAKKKAAAKGGRTNSNRRRGPDGRRGEAAEKLREFSEQDLEERRRRVDDAAKHRAGFDRHVDQASRRGTHVQAKTGVERGEPVDIEEPITVKTLSAALGVKSSDILRKLFMQGVRDLNINSSLDHDTAQTIALEYGIDLHIAHQSTLEEQLVAEFAQREINPENLRSRPPVVTILGHVDHGKTSLLDRIRKANVAAGEAGGITQHTAAWMVQLGDKRVTFIDTPGHQAFTSMRARGANMTDVVVLVVSAAEGVQPQTIESINHAKAAEVPIVVAMNKIDRPDSNEQQVLGQLAAAGLNPVEWGGDTEVIRTSAVTGQGIEDLIEILHYQAELLDLKADPTLPARGTVIEATINPGLGPVATVLVQEGTLKVGDVMLCGPGFGRIRTLLNDRGESIPEAGPSTPVVVSGLNEEPQAGDGFYVVDNLDRARTIGEERHVLNRQEALADRNRVTLTNLYDTIEAGLVKTINLIIKADVAGSVETLAKTVTDANTNEVKVRVIHAAVGGITESDVELADASNAVIIGFHVVPEESARALAEQRRVEIRQYQVIYEIFDDLKKALSGLLEPEIREKLHGHAEIRQVFKVSRVGNIGGCMVTDGHIQRGSKIRLSRGGIVITEDLSIETLRRVKDDVKEVKAGFECGIKLANYDDIKIGDILEAYIRETFQRTL